MIRRIGSGSFLMSVGAAFAPTARRVEKVRGQARLSGPRGAGDQDRAAAIVPFTAEHLVEMPDPGRDTVQRGLMAKGQGGNRQDADAVGID